MKNDPRYIALKTGLSQLNTWQLIQITGYQGEMCLDDYNYDETNKTY